MRGTGEDDFLILRAWAEYFQAPTFNFWTANSHARRTVDTGGRGGCSGNENPRAICFDHCGRWRVRGGGEAPRAIIFITEARCIALELSLCSFMVCRREETVAAGPRLHHGPPLEGGGGGARSAWNAAAARDDDAHARAPHPVGRSRRRRFLRTAGRAYKAPVAAAAADAVAALRRRWCRGRLVTARAV